MPLPALRASGKRVDALLKLGELLDHLFSLVALELPEIGREFFYALA
jgi:hypothetical protein